MSDDEDLVSACSTPVPELDDHRHQLLGATGTQRPRRPTFDSLYASAQLDDPMDDPSNEAVIVDEADLAPPSAPFASRSRRPTFESILAPGDRSASPPNSVKAFAQVRRRDRAPSIDRAADASSIRSGGSGHSKASKVRSMASKARGTDNADARSLKSKSTPEEDVCYRHPQEDPSHHSRIDFSVLEAFVEAERTTEDPDAVTRRPSVQAFPNFAGLGDQDAMVTTGGDFVFNPSTSDSSNEKNRVPDTPQKAVKVEDKPPGITNRFSFFSSAWESTAHARTFAGLMFDEDVRQLFSFPVEQSDGVWWLDVNYPTEEEIRILCKAFSVHPLTVEDIITQEAREKIELFPDYYFASFRSFRIVEDDDEIEYEPFNVYVVVFGEGTLSFSFQANSHANKVRQRISTLKEYVSLSSDWICYALIDNIVDSYAPVIDKLERDIDMIEDEVFVARQEDMGIFLRKIGVARKQTMSLHRLLNGKADVLRGFTKRCNADYKVTPRLDIGLYLGDIQDHIVTMHNNIHHFEKILSRTHSNYLGHLTIESIASGNHVNKVLSRITVLGSIFLPLNFVCGLFGMNVLVPFGESKSLVPFFVILGVLTLFSVSSWTVAKRRRYL